MGAPIAPPVRVRVLDDTGAVIPGVFVSMSLLSPPEGVMLSGSVNAVADVSGVATFANLRVNAPAAGLRLRAQATFPGGFETGTSDPFDVGGLDETPATVTITNYSAIYDGLPKPVTVTTDPPRPERVGDLQRQRDGAVRDQRIHCPRDRYHAGVHGVEVRNTDDCVDALGWWTWRQPVRSAELPSRCVRQRHQPGDESALWTARRTAALQRLYQSSPVRGSPT